MNLHLRLHFERVGVLKTWSQPPKNRWPCTLLINRWCKAPPPPLLLYLIFYCDCRRKKIVASLLHSLLGNHFWVCVLIFIALYSACLFLIETLIHHFTCFCFSFFHHPVKLSSLSLFLPHFWFQFSDFVWSQSHLGISYFAIFLNLSLFLFIFVFTILGYFDFSLSFIFHFWAIWDLSFCHLGCADFDPICLLSLEFQFEGNVTRLCDRALLRSSPRKPGLEGLECARSPSD